jgi:hypothetical protein
VRERRKEKADAACVGESGDGDCGIGNVFERGVRGAGGQPGAEGAKE